MKVGDGQRGAHSLSAHSGSINQSEMYSNQGHVECTSSQISDNTFAIAFIFGLPAAYPVKTKFQELEINAHMLGQRTKTVHFKLHVVIFMFGLKESFQGNADLIRIHHKEPD